MVQLLKSELPLASVVVPIYNSSVYLEESMASILSQTYGNMEVIAIDDGSSDASGKILKKYKDRRVRIVTHAKNRGLVRTLNEGVEKARGKYIVRMDPDDVAEKNRIQKQVEYMETHPEIDILGSWITVFGVHNYLWNVHKSHEYIEAKLLFENSLPHPALILRKNSLTSSGLRYEEGYAGAEDYMLWSKLAEKGLRFANLQESLLKYRTHERQVGMALRKKQQDSSWLIRKYNIERLGIHPTGKQKEIHQKLASWVPLSTLSEIRKAGKWLEHLMAANNTKKIYSRLAFRKIIGERWTVMCYISAQSNMKRALLLGTSPMLVPLAIETLYLRARGRLYEAC